MKRMTKAELIAALQALDVPDVTPVTLPVYDGLGFDDVRYVQTLVTEDEHENVIKIITLKSHPFP